MTYNCKMLSLHFTPREVRATESRLLRVYEAARLGLSNDALALKAGMMPEEFRKLCQLDPVVELAAMQGRAEAEAAMSQVVYDAAVGGDAKMALEFLKHKHAWTAAQAITVDVTQTISIITALEQANQRVANGLTIDEADYRDNGNRPLINNREKDGDDYQDINSRPAQRAASV
jgi:hypothetical protein